MADKGLDEVRVFRLDALGKLHGLPDATVRLRWGCGPRHLRFHPTLPYLYILNELDSTIVSAKFDARTGGIEPFQVLPSQSDVYTQIHRASEIDVSPDGRFVYASNRGQNTIGVFAVAADGRLSPVQFADAGGKVPRHFAIAGDGRHLYVANEFSDSIVQFAIAEDGSLRQMRAVANTGTPTCIVLT
jgi:6-phosphogluconolactonase (cycloisomerase 2 family)